MDPNPRFSHKPATQPGEYFLQLLTDTPVLFGLKNPLGLPPITLTFYELGPHGEATWFGESTPSKAATTATLGDGPNGQPRVGAPGIPNTMFTDRDYSSSPEVGGNRQYIDHLEKRVDSLERSNEQKDGMIYSLQNSLRDAEVKATDFQRRLEAEQRERTIERAATGSEIQLEILKQQGKQGGGLNGLGPLDLVAGIKALMDMKKDDGKPETKMNTTTQSGGMSDATNGTPKTAKQALDELMATMTPQQRQQFMNMVKMQQEAARAQGQQNGHARAAGPQEEPVTVVD